MMDHRDSHLEILVGKTWYVWHGTAADFAWNTLFLAFFFVGLATGFAIGYSL